VFGSLRARVALTAVAAVALSSLLVMLSIAFALGPLSRHNQEVKLHTILDRAIALEGNVPTERLADRLSEPGFSVVVNQNGTDYTPTGSSTIIRTIDSDANYITASETLPKTGVTVTVATVRLSTFDVYSQILEIGVPTIAVVLIVLVLALRRVTGLALRPLSEMTDLAVRISEGERGRRLEVKKPNSELGKTAIAFDRMLDELEASLARAQAAESRLRQLCADVAHELRTPLSSMVAAADNLLRDVSIGDGSAASTRDLAETTAIAVVRDGRRASRIVGDLTLAAQLDVAELAEREVVKRSTDLNQLAQQAVDTFAVSSEFEIDAQIPQLPAVSMVDPERIQQIITNLLSNAGRWSSGRISVSVVSQVNAWQLIVADDGPGVPDSERERIFDRFVRLDTARARAKGGSGLGLAISRALAQAHGGTLECLGKSATLGGAEFRLILPLA
jgi:two-component system OmpR family sensor kinase